MRDSVRLVVTVEDLEQVGTAASQHSSMSHQFVTTHLEKKLKTLKISIHRRRAAERKMPFLILPELILLHAFNPEPKQYLA